MLFKVTPLSVQNLFKQLLQIYLFYFVLFVNHKTYEDINSVGSKCTYTSFLNKVFVWNWARNSIPFPATYCHSGIWDIWDIPSHVPLSLLLKLYIHINLFSTSILSQSSTLQWEKQIFNMKSKWRFVACVK